MNIDQGTYLIDKPPGWTSFDVVAKIRSHIKKETGKKVKVGHTGTLDPFATGLLIILVGPATKKQANYMKLDKEYEATLFLGATSTTGDPEGEIKTLLPVIPSDLPARSVTRGGVEESRSLHSSRDDIEEKFYGVTNGKIKKVVHGFIGEIEQVPPQYSALKVKGKPAYKLARAGQKVNLKSRKITIYNIEMLDYKWPKLKLKVNCSSGTYIRTLAEDIGRVLGCGAYLTSLNRTKIGNLSLEKAKKLEELLS
jgi:tRNA pseudouridine55 synthase